MPFRKVRWTRVLQRQTRERRYFEKVRALPAQSDGGAKMQGTTPPTAGPQTGPGLSAVTDSALQAIVFRPSATYQATHGCRRDRSYLIRLLYAVPEGTTASAFSALDWKRLSP